MHVADVSATMGLMMLVGFRAIFKECRFILSVDSCPACRQFLEVGVLLPIFLLSVALFLWSCDVRTYVELVCHM